MKSILPALLAFCVSCIHTGVKRQEGGVNTGISSAETDLKLDDYIGTWKVEKATYGCSPIKIEKGPKGTVKITRRSSVTISATSPFDSLPEHTVSDYYKYKISTSTLHKFIRGKIVSAHIWSPNTDDFLGVGLRAWMLDKETLIKKKSGITMQNKFNDPREKAVRVFNLNGDDIILRWKIECKYIRS